VQSAFFFGSGIEVDLACVGCIILMFGASGFMSVGGNFMALSPYNKG